MSEGPRTERLFIALELPEELRRRLARVREESGELGRELRWVRPEGLHVTLRFLGDTDVRRRGALEGGLAALSVPPPFELECVGLGTFGPPSRPRVLWAGLGGELHALRGLQREVEALCARLGWPAEGGAYAPHVTLARGRGRLERREEMEALLSRHGSTPFGGFRAEAVTLYRSQLGPGGSVHTPVYKRSLGRGQEAV